MPVEVILPKVDMDMATGQISRWFVEEGASVKLGDVLFVVVNLARHAMVDPAQALRRANAKFERRFRRMETLSAEAGESLSGKSLAEQDALWDRAKAEERRG